MMYIVSLVIHLYEYLGCGLDLNMSVVANTAVGASMVDAEGEEHIEGASDSRRDGESGEVADVNARAAAEFLQRLQGETRSVPGEGNARTQENEEERESTVGQVVKPSKRKMWQQYMRRNTKRKKSTLEDMGQNFSGVASTGAGEQ